MGRRVEHGDVPVGATVVAANGQPIGNVREVHPHYLVIEREFSSADLDIPLHAVVGIEEGSVRLSVNLEALTELPAEEQTAGRRIETEE